MPFTLIKAEFVLLGPNRIIAFFKVHQLLVQGMLTAEPGECSRIVGVIDRRLALSRAAFSSTELCRNNLGIHETVALLYDASVYNLLVLICDHSWLQ